MTRLTLLRYTRAPLAKLLPFTVSVKGEAPMTTALGFKEEIDGKGYWTSTDTLFELPPPGDGVATVTGRFPAFEAVIADVGIAAFR